jgi:hypothetical protein
MTTERQIYLPGHGMISAAQMRQIEDRALRIGRRIYPGSEKKAVAFQADYVRALSIAALEEITGMTILDGDVALKQ